MKERLSNPKLNLKELFPFKLDDFQQKAIAALDAGKSVVVCAPTGSGKTLIGEYAIYRALSRGKRVFYTTPLKALSNQKFRDFQERFGSWGDGEATEKVGLITGDVVYNPNAPIAIMTTEIFRNILYETPIGQVGTSLENVESVVLDECHYISDRGRGTVWEESIIYCPPTIQLVALSATIGNPEELTDWIERVRLAAGSKENGKQVIYHCALIDSDYRPVPLRFFFSTKEKLYPLLNSKQTAINPSLKSKSPREEKRRRRREDCPSILTVVEQLVERDLLPAIYAIFSRRGCDQAVRELEDLVLVNESEAKAIIHRLLVFFLSENPDLQERLLAFLAQETPILHKKLLDFLANNPDATSNLLDFLSENPQEQVKLWDFMAEKSHFIRFDQLEPLTRGIAAHHAGILPVWKELVEQLFEQGLVKVVFATATLSAGINMPARTTVISALSRRTDDGHSMLTPSEFLQLAGRAGRRGKDEVGYVVTVQTPFEGAKEAAYLATAKAEPLKSCFTPSYGMVLNLLQKHTLEEAKELLERSFAEYLAQSKLAPEKKAIAELTTELAKIDVELAGLDDRDFASYAKLKERLKEEERLLKILQQQAEANKKHEIASRLAELSPGSLLAIKGKHVKVASPLSAVFVAKIPGSGQAPDLVCLGEDNRWYIVTLADITDILPAILPQGAQLSVPELEALLEVSSYHHCGPWHKGDEKTAAIAQQITRRLDATAATAPEVIAQQERIDRVRANLDNHPLQQQKNPARLLKLHQRRLTIREQLYRSHAKYQNQQAHKSYYWQDFLNLIEILREFRALDGLVPTPLGQAAATIRGENELWLGLALMSGAFDRLEPHQLAAAMSALITEPLRPDTWTNYPPSQEVLEAFRKTESQEIGLREIRRQLYQAQARYDIAIPVWLDTQLMGLIEQWVLGIDWNELCDNTSLDEGDIVRLLRRTIDLLWQIPQIPGVPISLKSQARVAVSMMKRFPV
ncbi:MAG: DEAD/DEAH box helicase [Hydrococcus sp. C42_A2020_068]|uniref:DEAD/DEAH box helicase n=1 Tax=Pleurocapsa sp. PCC 7327 TaxID=118163 RepID=UPI00059DCF70|nr:DEAD/DEAH box helicase [Pleurocapsa sp. PCC 7327]MBF2021197.1 DEAD/DEAH box helicase [Hydrococcus sp. C42_A2020_068]